MTFAAGIDPDRFWAHVERAAPDACWPWRGFCGPKGYGRVWIGPRGRGGRPFQAHRIAWELQHEKSIPAGQYGCHHCDNPPCCNPGHVFVGSPLDNMRDAQAKGRLNVPHPQLRKVTDAQLNDIDLLLAHGAPKALLAKYYGVSEAWIAAYVNGTRRKYPRAS